MITATDTARQREIFLIRKRASIHCHRICHRQQPSPGGIGFPATRWSCSLGPGPHPLRLREHRAYGKIVGTVAGQPTRKAPAHLISDDIQSTSASLAGRPTSMKTGFGAVPRAGAVTPKERLNKATGGRSARRAGWFRAAGPSFAQIWHLGWVLLPYCGIGAEAERNQAGAGASKRCLTITKLASANRVWSCAVFLARPR